MFYALLAPTGLALLCTQEWAENGWVWLLYSGHSCAQVLAGSLRLLAECVQVCGEHARWALPSQLFSPFGHFLSSEKHQAEGNGLTLPVQDQAEREKEKLLNYLN